MLGGTTELGGALEVGVDNPLGTQSPGALAFLAIASAPDPSYPCGTPLPGFGMAGGAGELLVALGPGSWIQGPAPWSGAGQPAPFTVTIPDAPAFVGKDVYLQGAILDPAGPISHGLTEALEVEVSAAALPDLHLCAAWLDSIPVGPSVFERVEVGAPLSGRRDIRIYGYDVPALKSVTVYYAIHVEE